MTSQQPVYFCLPTDAMDVTTKRGLLIRQTLLARKQRTHATATATATAATRRRRGDDAAANGLRQPRLPSLAPACPPFVWTAWHSVDGLDGAWIAVGAALGCDAATAAAQRRRCRSVVDVGRRPRAQAARIVVTVE